MHKLHFSLIKLSTPAALLLVVFTLAACSAGAEMSRPPDITPRPGPAWTPQQAIEAIDTSPLSTGDLAWNAEFDRYQGRWRVTLLYRVRKMYPPRDERQTLIWYVYEDTGQVEGPFR